jgi:hypothetical protein
MDKRSRSTYRVYREIRGIGFPAIVRHVLEGQSAVSCPVGGVVIAPAGPPTVSEDEISSTGDGGVILISDEEHRVAATRVLAGDRHGDIAGLPHRRGIIPTVINRDGKGDRLPIRERTLDVRYGLGIEL